MAKVVLVVICGQTSTGIIYGIHKARDHFMVLSMVASAVPVDLCVSVVVIQLSAVVVIVCDGFVDKPFVMVASRSDSANETVTVS